MSMLLDTLLVDCQVPESIYEPEPDSCPLLSAAELDAVDETMALEVLA